MTAESKRLQIADRRLQIQEHRGRVAGRRSAIDSAICNLQFKDSK
jgi:hypothetical protein